MKHFDLDITVGRQVIESVSERFGRLEAEAEEMALFTEEWQDDYILWIGDAVDYEPQWDD